MKRENWIVDDFSIRPAGKPDECFYCQEKKGTPHKADCVIRSRTVVVRLTAEYVIDVPENWEVSLIEFSRNESSSCANNILDELGRLGEKHGCLCGILHTEYLREATPEDETEYKTQVSDIPS